MRLRLAMALRQFAAAASAAVAASLNFSVASNSQYIPVIGA